MVLKLDCAHFPGDKPCRYHKNTGIKCPKCPHYKPLKKKVYELNKNRKTSCAGGKKKRILIIKTGAAGDILRTTPLLHAMNAQFDKPEIIWIAERNSVELLRGNKYITRIIPWSKGIIKEIEGIRFDIIINPENIKQSAYIAESIYAGSKFGYGLKPEGYIYPFTPDAERWLEMSAFDDVKKANRKTYQDILFSMCGLRFNPEKHKIILPDIKREKSLPGFKNRKQQIRKMNGGIIGLHTGAGKRWALKKWDINGYAALAEKILRNSDLNIVLLGGRLEQARNSKIKGILANKGLKAINVNTQGSIKNFIDVINSCNLVVCGDTLALHIALGLGKKIVALFGPTSPREIEMYGCGVKIAPALDCACCYRGKCNEKPNCMDMISVDKVYNAVVKLIN